MSSTTHTASFAAWKNKYKNKQARTTVGILNTIRWVGTALFALNIVILFVFGIIEWADPHTSGVAAVGTIAGIVFTAITGLVFYAIVGWFVDSLNLLTQIAKNTA